MTRRQVAAAPQPPAAAQQVAAAPPVPAPRELARRVRTTKTLSPAQRRYWLAVLPHLRPADRDRLDAILRGTPNAGAQ